MASRPCARHKRFVIQCAACVKKRETAQRASGRAHAKRIDELYGITPEEYAAILAAQGGVCFICHRPPGRVRLSVDHDHKLEEQLLIEGFSEREARRLSIRGLLDKGCNYRILGWLKDSIEALDRAIDYLTDPPARKVLA